MNITEEESITKEQLIEIIDNLTHELDFHERWSEKLQQELKEAESNMELMIWPEDAHEFCRFCG